MVSPSQKKLPASRKLRRFQESPQRGGFLERAAEHPPQDACGKLSRTVAETLQRLPTPSAALWRHLRSGEPLIFDRFEGRFSRHVLFSSISGICSHSAPRTPSTTHVAAQHRAAAHIDRVSGVERQRHLSERLRRCRQFWSILSNRKSRKIALRDGRDANFSLSLRIYTCICF